MNDTPDWIRRKQIEIFLAKPEQERWTLGLGMIDEVRIIVRNAVLQEKPQLSEVDLAVEVFKRYYRNDFTPPLLEQMSVQMAYFLRIESAKIRFL